MRGGQSANDNARGRRRPLATRLRSAVLLTIRRIESLGSRSDPPARLTLAPRPRDPAEASDIAGRLNWFLPADARNVPISAPENVPGIEPMHAPYLDPGLVHDPEWIPADSPRTGREHILIHRLTPSSLFRMIRHPRDFTLVDPSFAFGSDEAFFEVTRKFCRFPEPEPRKSFELVMERKPANGRALALATGPSADEIDRSEFKADLRITCNSAIRDRSLIEEMRPNLIAFSDPVFHYGPSRYASEFRRDLRRVLDSSDTTFVTSKYFVAPLLVAMPEIVSRLAVFTLRSGVEWSWPEVPSTELRATGNVLTNLMLPVAFALATEVRIGGCDGRSPNERYFWRHNPARQYQNELMESAFESHPGFFKYRLYEDYYETHCAELQSLIVKAEADGRKVVNVTPSHIPALRARTPEGVEIDQ